MFAIRALVHFARLLVAPAHAVRACRHAVLAPDAARRIDLHGAVLGAEARTGRANAYARRIGTVVALFGHVGATHAAVIRQHIPTFDPHVELALRHVVLDLAGNGTRIATDAFGQVNDHSQTFFAHDAPPYRTFSTLNMPPFRIGVDPSLSDTPYSTPCVQTTGSVTCSMQKPAPMAGLPAVF